MDAGHALEQLRANDPRGALEQLKQEVRAAPRDAGLRTFLFQLFCIHGEWDRALTQLSAAAELDPEAVPMAQTYQALIRAEQLREKILAGERTPTVFGAPEPWMSLLFEANRLRAAGEPNAAVELREQAFAEAPASAGTLDGVAFEWIADADPRFGPMLEAIVDGRYFWVPMHRLHSVTAEPPTDLRDKVWMPAQFRWTNDGETVGFIPTRYPGSTTDPDLALARRTEWADDTDWPVGRGQRMFATDAGDTALLDLRRLELSAER